MTDLMRAALVAIKVWKLTIFNRAVSISCACANGPSICKIGSLLKTKSPSKAERTVQVNLKFAK